MVGFLPCWPACLRACVRACAYRVFALCTSVVLCFVLFSCVFVCLVGFLIGVWRRAAGHKSHKRAQTRAMLNALACLIFNLGLAGSGFVGFS